jgi:hypothetical protein
MKMPFGKYQGCEIENIPESYLKWLKRSVPLYGDLKAEVEGVLSGDWPRYYAATEVGGDSAVIKEAYRTMAKKIHPDAGGSNEAMKAINCFYDLLRNKD